MVTVKLGPLLKEYSAQLFTWRNDESIFKWCRQVDLLTEIGHEKWMQSHQLDKTIKMYSIIDTNYAGKKDNWNTTGLVGVCGLTDIDLINQRAEFSLYIGPEFQKKGYAKAALKLLLEIGFSRYPLKTIWGETFEKNPAYNMFLTIGFKPDGTRRSFYFKDGHHIDAHLVSITREEFNATKNINYHSFIANSWLSVINNISNDSSIEHGCP